MPVFEACGKQIRIGGRLVRVAQLEGDGYQFLDDPQPMIDNLARCGRRVDLFTFMQRLPDTEPKYSYPMEWDNLATLPITTFEHWWNSQIGFKARNKAKQAEKKGVVVREVPFDDKLVEGIREVYNESPVRQGGPNRHYGKSFDTVRREAATFLDSSIFIGAYLEEKLIGFIKLVYDETRTQAGLMNIVSMVCHRDKAPSNALIVESVRACAQRKIPYLVYARFAYAKKEQSSLADFKARNGFQRVDLPRYYVPLTGLGRLSLRTGLHRRMVDLLPAALVGRLRELRAAWYQRKFQSAAEIS